MHVTQWKEPALNWNGAVAEDGRANILEIRSDQFIPQFLQAMGTDEPAQYFQAHRADAGLSPGAVLKLYQPLHGCFYLVTASLVCRQLGLPDKAVDRATGESVFFVIRRRATAGEEAWIATEGGGHWQLLAPEEALTLAPGEERLPMHAVTVCPKPQTPQSVFTDFVERDLYYGYIPTGNRDKYKDTVGRVVTADATPQDFVNDFIAQAEADVPASVGYSFRKDLFMRRVYLPWEGLLGRLNNSGTAFSPPINISTTAQEQQLYTIVELGDFLKNNLPTLWAALKAGSDDCLAGAMAALYELLTDDLEVESENSMQPLADVVLQFEEHFDLVRGKGEIPASDLNLKEFTIGANDDEAANLRTLRDRVDDAIEEETAPIDLPDGESSELVQLIRHQVQPRDESQPLYHIRTVYEYDSQCPPVVSVLPTQPFQLTKFFEPGAPARLVRLEAPSIKPQDLRQYARGVGIEMSPELHKLASCLGGDDIQGVMDSAGSCEDGGLSIQMICTFSIQIIFLVAFIVMFIFLISLNFVFWWLAYLRICLPIPRKS